MWPLLKGKDKRCQLQGNPCVGIIKDFKEAFITVLHQVKKKFRMNKRVVVLSREIKTIKKNQMELLEPKNTKSEIKKFTG